jgi:hypothetical protein
LHARAVVSQLNLGPFHNRPWEWELYQPLFGCSMLELGNKRNRDFTYKFFFASLGFTHVSVDMNGADGALALDLRRPLRLGTFDMVTNIGTTEHVAEFDAAGQMQCWRNILEAMHVGSVLISTTPAPGCWPWHGYWYPAPEFFEELARLNGLEVVRLYRHDMDGDAQRGMVFARLVRLAEMPFEMPANGMSKNLARAA